MFFKFIIAVIITAGFAGGVVYYGIGMPPLLNLSKPEPTLEPAKKANLTIIMPMLMMEAEKINTVEIKDQAYLDVVSFSVSQRQYNFADKALQKISQTELRDTARSRIAIAMAMDGRAAEAFDIIDTVEIEALRDVMRLQVIETLIIPEQLPAELLRK